MARIYAYQRPVNLHVRVWKFVKADYLDSRPSRIVTLHEEHVPMCTNLLYFIPRSWPVHLLEAA